jgi:hypothetical protein
MLPVVAESLGHHRAFRARFPVLIKVKNKQKLRPRGLVV